MDSSSLIALAALVIASATAWRALKSYRAGQRSELPEVRVWSSGKEINSQGTHLSLKIHNPPFHSSWKIAAVEAIHAKPTRKCFANGSEWRNYFEFRPPVRSGEVRSICVRPESSDVVLTWFFKSPRRSRWRSIICWLGLRRIPLAMGVAWEKRWSDVFQVSLKPREGDGSGTARY